jgi:hypothetical protein
MAGLVESLKVRASAHGCTGLHQYALDASTIRALDVRGQPIGAEYMPRHLAPAARVRSLNVRYAHISLAE